jgi:DNA recombination protein RmuC
MEQALTLPLFGWLLIPLFFAAAGFGLGLLLRARETGRLQAEMARAGEQLQTLQPELERLRDEVTQLQTRSQVQQAQLEHAQHRLQEKNAEITALSERREALEQTSGELRREIAEQETRAQERESHYAKQLQLLQENREQLKQEFENLANRIFEDKGKRFTSANRDALESLLKPFREQISGFQTRVNQVHAETIRGSAALEAELKKLLDVGLKMSDQAANLTLALKGDKKAAGNWGEAQLERTLELAGLQPGEHYDSQASLRDEHGRRKLPDFLIKLPDGKNLVIDSKVSLVDYDRAVAAETDEARAQALGAHVQAVRRHIDDLASKDYSNLPGIGSPDFVLMFMPVEPAYIEAMKQSRDLFNYGYGKRVIMVSHTTLMPILRTVANLWMIDRSNREAMEISSRAGEIFNQVCLVAERLNKLGNTLKTASNHYNDVVTGVIGQQGLHGKVERFQALSAKAKKSMPDDLAPLHTDINTERLRLVVDDAGDSDEDPHPAAPDEDSFMEPGSDDQPG